MISDKHLQAFLDQSDPKESRAGFSGKPSPNPTDRFDAIHPRGGTQPIQCYVILLQTAWSRALFVML